MRRTANLALFAACLFVTAGALRFAGTSVLENGPAIAYAAAAPATCQFPQKPAATPQQTVWQMFTAANCPWQQGNGTMQAVWESWPTQEEVFTSGAQPALLSVRNGSATRFHTSFQQQTFAKRAVTPMGLVAGPNTACSKSAAAPHRVLCEEVRLNPAAAAYIKANGLSTHAGQGAFVAAGKTIAFPSDAMEVKGDWLPNCKNPKLHVESIGGKSYCLIAMHIISKMVPQWEWGTWEAKDDTATPNRCVSIGCQDSFGSNPAVIPAGAMAKPIRDGATQTPALRQLEQSGGLTAEWANYSLDSAQDSFVTASGKPILSGNSITEEEIPGTPLTQCSCMTCHAYSAVNRNGLDSIATLKATVGKPVPLPNGYAPRDLVWSFLTAPSAPTPKPPAPSPKK